MMLSDKTKGAIFTAIKAIFSALVVLASSLIGEKLGDTTVAVLGSSIGTSIAIS